MAKTNLAIFASGSGTNAENIIRYFSKNPDVEVVLVLCNNAQAGVLDRARRLLVETHIFNNQELKDKTILHLLQQKKVNWVVLAGFLWRIPPHLVNAFPQRIINIHPALLPKFGGKGMYGMNVHKVVKAAGEIETGITIHYIDEAYDRGQIIFQAKAAVDAKDSAVDIAAKIHKLEMKHFPVIIEKEIRRASKDSLRTDQTRV
ncbi:MAG: phosphoribosylglycinamide formyltransferase [Bacteroidia bacterium]